MRIYRQSDCPAFSNNFTILSIAPEKAKDVVRMNIVLNHFHEVVRLIVKFTGVETMIPLHCLHHVYKHTI